MKIETLLRFKLVRDFNHFWWYHECSRATPRLIPKLLKPFPKILK
jgi:hypothetical protein